MMDELIKLISQREYKVISVDVYDTLLFRLVRKPRQLFKVMYQKSPELFPDYMNGDDWRELRSKIETTVKRDVFASTKRKEITLSDIYSNMPNIIKNRDKLLALELECEKYYSYVNEEIEQFIKYVHDNKCKIILTSDMYLSMVEIKEILAFNKFDLSLIDRLYVSSDYNATKRSGELFEIILQDYNISPVDMIHIGDHRISDFSIPKKLGIDAYWYDLVSTANLHFSQLRIEEALYDNICGEIYVTRLLATKKAPKSEEGFWFALGAMQLGPLMTYAAEWALNLAEQEGIKQIYPLMREGKFLSEILNYAKEQRGLEVKIEPLYISRKALYPSMLSVLKEKDIQYNLTTKRMKLGSLLELLKAEELKTEYSQFLDMDVSDLKKTYDNQEEDVYTLLERKIKKKEFIDDLKARNKDSDSLLFRYLTQVGLTDEAFMTFDVGWRGNMQNAIQRILEKNNVKTKGIHLLINGKKFIMDERNLEDSCDIRGYTGNFGKNEKEIAGLINHVFELFFMCDVGTTVGYNEKEGQILPVLKEIDYNSDQIKAIRLVQLGVLSFQEEFYMLKAKKGVLLSRSGYENETLKIMQRLLQYPTTKEANMIGALSFDQNFGIDIQWNVISKIKLVEYEKYGYGRFIHENLARSDEWYYGMNAIINPLGYIKEALFFQRNSESYQMLLFAERIINTGGDSFALAGAGKHCFLLLAFLDMADRLNNIEVILDEKSSLLGGNIKGIPVVDYSAVLKKSETVVITLMDINVIQKIKQKIQHAFGEQVEILDYYTI